MAPKIGAKMWNNDEPKDARFKHPQIKVAPFDGDTKSIEQKHRSNKISERKCSCNQSQLGIAAKVENARIKYGRSMSEYDVRVERKPHRSLSTSDVPKPKTKAESVNSVGNLVKHEKEESHLSTYTKVLNYLRKWRRSLNSKFVKILFM